MHKYICIIFIVFLLVICVSFTVIARDDPHHRDSEDSNSGTDNEDEEFARGMVEEGSDDLKYAGKGKCEGEPCLEGDKDGNSATLHGGAKFSTNADNLALFRFTGESGNYYTVKFSGSPASVKADGGPPKLTGGVFAGIANALQFPNNLNMFADNTNKQTVCFSDKCPGTIRTASTYT